MFHLLLDERIGTEGKKKKRNSWGWFSQGWNHLAGCAMAQSC
jgi:hypothetical protein